MPYFILILLGSIWGASYLFIKVGGESVPPVTLVAMRTSLAGVVLFFALKLRREPLPPRSARVWRWLAVMAVLNSVGPYTLITWGEVYISSGLAAILVGAMPIFTVILAHWMTQDEKITARKLVGIAAGFIGVVILFLPDLGQGATFSIYGGLAVLAAAVSYAFASVYARKHLKGTPPMTTTFGQMLLASVILIPASLVLDRPWTLNPTPAAIASIVTLAVVGTAFAYLLYYWLISNVGATRTSLVTFVSPVIAVILGAVFLQEALEWTTLVGLVLIVGGVGLVTNVSLRRARGGTSLNVPKVTESGARVGE